MDKSTLETTVKRKRGSNLASSIESNNTASKTDISEIITNSYKWFNRPVVKDDEECAERLNEFFSECSRTGEIPTVEKMALALGTNRKTLWDWENRQTRGKQRSDIVKKAKEILAAIDAELAAKGKIPQVVYIFRSKNYYDMADKQEITVVPQNPMGDEQSAEEIQKRIESSIVIETEGEEID